MNAKYLIAAVTVLAATAGPALAQAPVAPDADFVSSKTRAEVIAELQQARADGSLEYTEYSYPVLKANGDRKTRAQVRAELAQYLHDRPSDVTKNLYFGS